MHRRAAGPRTVYPVGVEHDENVDFIGTDHARAVVDAARLDRPD